MIQRIYDPLATLVFALAAGVLIVADELRALRRPTPVWDPAAVTDADWAAIYAYLAEKEGTTP